MSIKLDTLTPKDPVEFTEPQGLQLSEEEKALGNFFMELQAAKAAYKKVVNRWQLGV
ncbi:MAG: hypothetical protein JSS30_01240 [Verrucomicrobia bacterium]|nr:hypothetical protein [Verrucomicrobiota bacterium]